VDDVRGTGEDARNGRSGPSTGWKDQPVPKGLPAWISVVASLVPVGLSNRYQWMSKAPGEKPGVLDRDHLVSVWGYRLQNRCLSTSSTGSEDSFSSSGRGGSIL